MKNDVYKTAKNGGDYAKFYSRYKNEYLSRLNRAIKSYDAVIAEHVAWINDPSIKLGNNPGKELVNRYVEDKWPKDIARNAAYKAIIEGIIEERQK